MDENDLAYLRNEGYPHGLIQAMTDLKSDFAKVSFFIDNSELMTMRDGVMLSLGRASRVHQFSYLTGWGSSSAYIFLGKHLFVPVDFLPFWWSHPLRYTFLALRIIRNQLLNDPGPALGPQHFGICESALSNASDIKAEVAKCLEIMTRNSPRGQTPLAQHIVNITEEVREMRAGLLASGKRVAIIICTDGVPTDVPSREAFLVRLRQLETLPVWLVIRLCTNEPHVVDFYNELDAELKISVDVLGDFQGEALDIFKQNPWLNYGLPLYRARERGFYARVLDFLDECPLSKGEQKEVCGVLFGKEKMEGCPEADVDMLRFLLHIDSLQEEEKLQWDPIKGKV